MRLVATLAAAGTLALAATAVFAQQLPPSAPQAAPAPQASPDGRRGPLSGADIEALTDARIAGIQAGLRLTPEQQRLWGPVEQALRGQAAMRAKRMEERRAAGAPGERPDLMQRLDRQAERVKERSDALQSLTTAMRPLWASLSEDQKRRLPLLLRTARVDDRRGRMADHHRHDRGMRDGQRHEGNRL